MSSIDSRSKEKQAYFEKEMEGDHVLLHLDSRKEEVKVPESCANNPALSLKVSYFFQGETTHDEKGLYTYLKFDGSYFCCEVPWQTIWGMTSPNGETKVWPEDIPKEIFLKMAGEKAKKLASKLLPGGNKSSEKKPLESRSETTKPKIAAVSKKTKTDSKEKAKKKSFLKRIK